MRWNEDWALLLNITISMSKIKWEYEIQIFLEDVKMGKLHVRIRTDMQEAYDQIMKIHDWLP